MTRALLALLLIAAVPAGAVQFHVPTHLPPRLVPADGEDGLRPWFGAGYAGARAPGMSLSGPGGFWEFAGRGSGKVQGHLRGTGFLLSGTMDPFGAGRRDTHGIAGGVEADILWAPWGGDLRAYAGLHAGLTMLDVRDPLAVNLAAGVLRVEPGTAVSIVPAVPLGLVLPVTLSDGWRLEAAADATLQAPGATFFTYGPGGPAAYESTRPVHADAAGGARLRLAYEPWRLGLEVLGRHTAGFGNNEPSAWGAVLLTLGAF
jgi:hypothetical protein